MTREDLDTTYENDGYQKTIGFLKNRGASRDVAETVAQDAWLHGRERCGQVKHDKHVVAWVNSIALNLLYRTHAANCRTDQLQTVKDPATNGSEVALITAIDMQRALQRCSPRHRWVLQMVCCEGYSCADVAQREGSSTIAVYGVLARARIAFAKAMGVNSINVKDKTKLPSDVGMRKPMDREAGSAAGDSLPLRRISAS
jgi:DNA-directed RNA polymerase specialized sigma24 family protein